MFGLKKPFKEEKRSRVLAELEIALLWSMLPMLAWQFAMLRAFSAGSESRGIHTGELI